MTISSPSPPSGTTGATIILNGLSWTPQTSITFAVGPNGGGCSPGTPLEGVSATVANDGTFMVTFTWPSLGAGIYAVCALGPGAPADGLPSTNTFTELSQAAPSISIPSSVNASQAVSLKGSNWYPAGTQVEILTGPAQTSDCSTTLTVLTSLSDGTINGSFTAPVIAGSYTITAVSPQGTCSGSVPPTYRTTATLTVVVGTGTATPTPGHGTATATPKSGTGTPTVGTGTPTVSPVKGTPTPGTKTPTPTPVSHNSCNIFTGSNCGISSGVPWIVFCLIFLVLFLLLLLLLFLLFRRRNEEVITTEEDITSQINPNTVDPMGAMRYMRTVRVTTQVADRNTGSVRRSTTVDYDEFVDSNGNAHRRRRT